MTTTTDTNTTEQTEQTDTKADTKTELLGEFTAAADRLRTICDRVESDLDAATSDWAERLQPTRDRLAGARRRLDALQSEAKDDVIDALDDLDDAMEDLQEAVTAASSEVAAEQATHLAGYRTAFKEQTDAWKGRIERLALQADLARMDLRDEIAAVHDDYMKARRTVWADLVRAESAGTETWESIRDRARDELDILGVNYNAILDKIKRSK